MWLKPWFLTGAFLWAAVSGERLLIMIVFLKASRPPAKALCRAYRRGSAHDQGLGPLRGLPLLNGPAQRLGRQPGLMKKKYDGD